MNQGPSLKRITFCLTACLVFLQSGYSEAQGQGGDEKIPPPMINLLERAGAGGESAALDHAKTHGIRFVQRSGQEALFPLILDMKPGVSPVNFDRSWLESRGIRIDAVSKSYMRVLVPLRLLRTLAQHPQIRTLHIPLRPIPFSTTVGKGDTVSQSVHLTYADSLQKQAVQGDSVKVAVLDMGFIGLGNAIAADELSSNTVKILLPGQSTLETVINHGVAVCEQVMDMAPGAKLYCIMAEDLVDMQNAADTIRAHQIRIVNHSVGWANFGYYDDTGPLDSLVNFSHDKDSVFWTVAAGNEAQRHWRGKWADANHNNLLDFPGGAETMQITGALADGSTVAVYLNWNEYANPQTDLDMYVYDKNSNLVDSSTFPQPAYEPSEGVFFPYSSLQAPYSIKVKKRAGPVSADTFDMTIFSPTTDLQYATPGSSTMDPAGAHGAFAVAAVSRNNWPLSTPAPEVFSSQGPTNDGRMKPDIAAPDSVSSWTYPLQGIRGTSYSSPTVAGAAALLKQKYPLITVKGIADTLRAMAKGIGSTKADSEVFGAGLLYVYLPPPVLVSPSNAASGLATSLTLAWSAVGNASNYHVQVSTNSSFTSIINQDSTLTVGSKSISGLGNGTTYYWRVRSKNSRGVSPWSGYWTFTTIRQFTLSVAGTNGTVTKSPNQALYDSGSSVQLSASPSAQYHFTAWSGDLTGSTNPVTITMNVSKNITANFAINSYTVTASAGAGGSVKPLGSQSVNYNDTLRDTATPNTGYSFVNWTISGGVTTSSGAVNGKFVVTGSGTVLANFSIKAFSLTTDAVNGTVTKSPDQSSYDSGTVVILTPVPSTGYHFVSWTGDLTGSSSPASITMTGAKNITAGFAINAYSVTVSAGSGGTVKPSGSQSVNHNDTLRDTATPGTGYSFVNWTVSGNVATTVGGAAGKFVVTGVGTVQANFTINTYSLTVTAGNGSVTKSPDQTAYDSGTVVTLTPVPSTGYHFTSWSGDLTGAANPAYITVTGAKNVTAGFVINVPDSPILSSPGNGSVNVDASSVFGWTAAVRAVTYQVQVSTTASFTDTVVNDTGLTVLSKTEGPFLSSATYYWRVNAKNGGGTGAWSVVWSFTTLPPVPSQVQPMSPKDTSKLTVDSAVFVWAKATPGVDRYMLEIADDSLMTNRIYSDTAIVDTEKAYKGFANKTTYWWHVAAHNIAGWGSASAVYRFSVAIPSTAVIPKNFSFTLGGMSNSRSFISYALPVAARVSIRIFTVQGRLAAHICDRQEPAGYYHTPISSFNLSNGYYLLDFEAGVHIIKKKLPLFR